MSQKKITFRKNKDQQSSVQESTNNQSTKKPTIPVANPDVKLIKEMTSLPGDRLKIRFEHESMDPSLTNSLRRVLMGAIRTYSLAFNLQISNNTTGFNNEFIISRLKMIPIRVDTTRDLKWLEQNLIFRFCDDDNWEEPYVNESDLDLPLSVHMLKIFDKEGNRITEYGTSDIFQYDMEIVTLRKQQKVHLSGEIASGIGCNHATWKGCQVAYKFENPVSLNQKKPSNGISPITKTANETIEEKQNYPQNSLGNPKSISLTLKSNGHFSTNDCFRIALDTLEENLMNLRSLIENPMASSQQSTRTTVEIIPHKDIDNYLQIKIEDLSDHDHLLATHTIGKLLAKHMYYRVQKMTNNDINQIRQTMTSYRQPHPLKRIIEINIKVPETLYPDLQTDPSLQLLDQTIDDLVQIINQLRYEFQ